MNTHPSLSLRTLLVFSLLVLVFPAPVSAVSFFSPLSPQLAEAPAPNSPAPGSPGGGNAANPAGGGGEPVIIKRLTNIPGLTSISGRNPNIEAFLNQLYLFGIGLAGTFAVIFLMWYGFQYMLSDTPFKVSQSRGRLFEVFLGLLLILSPVIIFSIINPDILTSIDLSQSLFGSLRGQ